MPVTRRVHFDSICIGFAPMCWHASPAADIHTSAQPINPWRNNKGTAVGAFELWERANAGRLSEINVVSV